MHVPSATVAHHARKPQCILGSVLSLAIEGYNSCRDAGALSTFQRVGLGFVRDDEPQVERELAFTRRIDHCLEICAASGDQHCCGHSGFARRWPPASIHLMHH
jgi:hypothetical protein